MQLIIAKKLSVAMSITNDLGATDKFCAMSEPHTFEAVTTVFTCEERRFTVKGKI